MREAGRNPDGALQREFGAVGTVHGELRVLVMVGKKKADTSVSKAADTGS